MAMRSAAAIPLRIQIASSPFPWPVADLPGLLRSFAAKAAQKVPVRWHGRSRTFRH